MTTISVPSLTSAAESEQAWKDARAAYHSAQEDACESNKAQLLPAMKARGAALIQVEFDGSGDSGSIQNMVALDAAMTSLPRLDNDPLDDIELTFSGVRNTSRAGLETATQELDFWAFVETFAHAVLERSGIDWYNNDGGFGEVSFTLVPASEEDDTPEELVINLTVNSRFTDYTQHDFEF